MSIYLLVSSTVPLCTKTHPLSILDLQCEGVGKLKAEREEEEHLPTED